MLESGVLGEYAVLRLSGCHCRFIGESIGGPATGVHCWTRVSLLGMTKGDRQFVYSSEGLL